MEKLLPYFEAHANDLTQSLADCATTEEVAYRLQTVLRGIATTYQNNLTMP